jgi:hypothetical protein
MNDNLIKGKAGRFRIPEITLERRPSSFALDEIFNRLVDLFGPDSRSHHSLSTGQGRLHDTTGSAEE